jgi:trigger factor
MARKLKRDVSTEHDHDRDLGHAAEHSHTHDDDHDHGHDHGHEHHNHDHDQFKFVEDPIFDVTYKGHCQYEVKVTVPVANEAKQSEEMYTELKDDAELPGFRRGRAPIGLLQKKFGKAVKGQVAAKLVGAAFEKLVKDQKLKPAGSPDIDGLENEKDRPEGEPLSFTLKFDVAPRVELGKYRGVQVERPVVHVDDKDVEESIDELRERHSTYEALKTGKAKKGDQVIIDFKGTIGGEAFSGGSAENYPYILGSKRFFPEFESALAGASTGDDLSCDVTFPGDYFAQDLRGKQAAFTIKVNEVKRKKKPKVNEEFAKEAGFESVADMQAKARENLEEHSSERSKSVAESRAIEAVVEASKFEISPKAVDAIARQHLEESLRRLIQQGLPREEFQEKMAELEAQSKESAVRAIRSMVVLNEIGEAEGIEVTEEDFEKEAQTLSKSLGADAEMVAQYLKQGEHRNTYADRIYRSKALAVIMDNAKIMDKELTREELDKEAPAPESEGEDDAD